MKGEVAVRPKPLLAREYKQIPALKPGESVLYTWGSFGQTVSNPLHTIRTTASRYGKILNMKLSVHKRDDGILVMRANEDGECGRIEDDIVNQSKE